MKTSRAFVFMICWLSLFNIAQGQLSTPDFHPKQYVVKAGLVTHRREELGILYDLTDSTILILPTKGVHAMLKEIMKQHGGILPSTDSLRHVLPVRTYRYSDIRWLSIYRKNSLIKGFLIGAAAGTAIMVGFTERDEKPKGFKLLPSDREIYVGAISVTMPILGIAAAAVMTKRINSREKSIAAEAQKRFRKFTIVEQAKQAALYR